MWAEKVGRGWAYHGLARDAPKWEKLEKAWMEANFGPAFMANLQKAGGVPLPMPKVCAEGGVSTVGGVSEKHNNPGGSGLAGRIVPSVTCQEDNPFCASYGLASALRHVGFSDHAEQLEARAA